MAETLFKKRITSHSGRETEIVSFIGREGPRVRLAILSERSAEVDQFDEARPENGRGGARSVSSGDPGCGKLSANHNRNNGECQPEKSISRMASQVRRKAHDGWLTGTGFKATGSRRSEGSRIL